MKVYLVIVKFQHPTSLGNYTTGIEQVFRRFKKTMEFLVGNQDKWAPTSTFSSDDPEKTIVTYYYDIETFEVDSDAEILYFLTFRNFNGYFNDPVPFMNKVLAEDAMEKHIHAGKDCRLNQMPISS